jgi:ribosomal protein L40E
MSWFRRHPFATAVFAIIFAIFALAAIFGSDEEERTDAIFGLIIIYVLLVGVYALAAWLYGKIFGRSESQPTVPPIPPFPQQQFPQWEWSARTAMPSSAPPPAPVAITCRQCGATNPPDAAFCDQCGARLPVPALPSAMPLSPPTPTAEDAIECPRCHTKQSSRVRFCTNCGLPRNSP